MNSASTPTQQPAPGRRDRKKQETRAALITAALELVAERGVDHVTVEDIAEAADVSSRTFFNYFSCKDDAITGTSPEPAIRISQQLTDAPPDLPVLLALHRALRSEVERIQQEQEQWLLRMVVVERNPSLLPRLIANGAQTEQLLTEAVAARIGVDPDRDAYPALLAAVALTVLRVAMVRWAACGGAQPLVELLDQAVDALAAGLPDPSRRPAA